MSKNIGIIFAGGSGVRMGSGLPKQFLEVNGQPIIIYTLEIFEDHPEIDEIYVACKEEYIHILEKNIRKYQIQKVRKIVPGGKNGQESIFNALSAAWEENSGDSIVLIHDGVRPFVSGKLISANIESVKKYGNGVTCTPLFETPVMSKNNNKIDEILPRDQIYTAQAPQSFYLDQVMKAHMETRKNNPDYDGLVDTCSMMKAQGYEPVVVKGNRGNIKVTTPEDLYLFRGLLSYRETEQSFGLSEGEIDYQLKK